MKRFFVQVEGKNYRSGSFKYQKSGSGSINQADQEDQDPDSASEKSWIRIWHLKKKHFLDQNASFSENSVLISVANPDQSIIKERIRRVQIRIQHLKNPDPGPALAFEKKTNQNPSI